MFKMFDLEVNLQYLKYVNKKFSNVTSILNVGSLFNVGGLALSFTLSLVLSTCVIVVHNEAVMVY